MTDSASDRLERAKRGDDQALSEMLSEATSSVRASLVGQIPSRWSSVLSEEDILQQTYTDAFVGIARFVPVGDGAFEAWLRALARNNLRDALRALEADKRGGGRAPVTGGSTAGALYDNLLAESAASPSRSAAREESARMLEEAVERLPEHYATVVRLYDLEGRSIEELARELGRSPGAVYLLRHRAHARLRELLGGGSGILGSSA